MGGAAVCSGNAKTGLVRPLGNAVRPRSALSDHAELLALSRLIRATWRANFDFGNEQTFRERKRLYHSWFPLCLVSLQADNP